MAREIQSHPTVRQIYAKELLDAGVVTQSQLDSLREAFVGGPNESESDENPKGMLTRALKDARRM